METICWLPSSRVRVARAAPLHSRRKGAEFGSFFDDQFALGEVSRLRNRKQRLLIRNGQDHSARERREQGG